MRSVTRCSLLPVPGLGALSNLGLALILSLALPLVLVRAGELEEIPE